EKRGLPSRDVNHDLIAAGHPRLNFEFGAFLANLPPHWKEKTHKPEECHNARTWAVGQVVAAQAALELLADRADPKKEKPWPEFAEYGCYACHHDLGEPSWRQQRGYGGRTPGALPWSNWYFAMPRLLAGRDPLGEPKEGTLRAEFKDLEGALRTPLRDRAKLS